MAEASSTPSTFLRACGALTHPLAWIAIVTLAVNDHVLKLRYPGVVTGKLSDFAGLVFFPLLLEALVEGGLASFGRYRGPSRALGLATIGISAVGFAWVKLTASGGEAYTLVLEFARAPFRALAGGAGSDWLRPSTLQDPTDLLALSALLVPIAIVRRRTRESASIRVA